MPRVDRMAFTATTEVSSHDKEVIMAWDGSDDPTGFFDQYSTLNDNVDAQEVDGDDGYSQFGSADPVVIPPPPSSIDSAPPSIDSSVAQPGSYPRSMTGPPSQQARYPHHLAVQSHSPHKVPLFSFYLKHKGGTRAANKPMCEDTARGVNQLRSGVAEARRVVHEVALCCRTSWCFLFYPYFAPSADREEVRPSRKHLLNHPQQGLFYSPVAT